jgi:protein TonB
MMVLPKPYTLNPYKSAHTAKVISGLLHALIFALMIAWQNNIQAPRIILPKSQMIALQFTPLVAGEAPATKTTSHQPKPQQLKQNKLNNKPITKLPANPKPKIATKPLKTTNSHRKTNALKTTRFSPANTSQDNNIPTQPTSTKTQQAAYVPPQFNAAHLQNPAPIYPSIARRRGWQGRVLLNVHICEQGKARRVMVSKSSGYAILDKAAKQAVEKWRFIAARKGDVQVASNVIVPINFKLN